MTSESFVRTLAIVGLSLLLGACAAGGDVRKPIPSEFFAAKNPSHRLVVMLPGRGDDLQSMKHKDVASIIQQSWPDADVILTGLTMPFYREGRAAQRLHDEIIEPARSAGAKEIWLMGISLGGMGCVLYEHEYPGQTQGLLLLSPYLGDQAIQTKIRDAGGLQAWQPGPQQALNSKTFQHELWRTLKDVSENSSRAKDVWLIYGADEPFREPIELVTPWLPPDHSIMLEGNHNWDLWVPAMTRLLKQVSSDQHTR